MLRSPVGLLVTWVTLLPLGPVSGQETGLREGFWVSAAAGGGVLGTSEAIALAAEVARLWEERKVTLRGTLVAEILDDGAWDIGVLYGVIRRRESGAVFGVLEAGAALTSVCDLRGSVFTGAGCEYSYAPGLVGAASLTLLTGGIGGLGLDAFLNVNPLRTFGGLGLALRLGKTR